MYIGKHVYKQEIVFLKYQMQRVDFSIHLHLERIIIWRKVE